MLRHYTHSIHMSRIDICDYTTFFHRSGIFGFRYYENPYRVDEDWKIYRMIGERPYLKTVNYLLHIACLSFLHFYSPPPLPILPNVYKLHGPHNTKRK